MNIKKTATCLAGFMFAVSLFAVNNSGKKIVKVGNPVDSGYLFYDGKYIESPYEFTRNGFSVFVNGYKIYFPEATIKYLLRNRNITNVNVADIPKNITYEEFNNPEKPWGAYESKKIREINISSQTSNEAKTRIINFYSKLPFVKKVYENKDLPTSFIVIETYHGDKTNILLGKKINVQQKVKRFLSKSDAEKIVERECAEKNWKELKKGGCVFLFSENPEKLILSPGDVKNNLPEIIDVLNSTDSDNVKINKLYRLRVFPERKNKRANMLAENYKSNDQLSRRIADILIERKTANFKRVKVEDKPTKEELIIVKKQAFENAQKEWRKKYPEEYKRKQKNQKLYLEKLQYISKKGKKYWEEHKEELEKEIDEIKKLKAQM